MRFSERWLREWVDPPLATQELGERLTMAGLELEGITAAASAFSGVVVARVLRVAPHPDAERLKVCELEVGESEPLQVVCGAPNVVQGMLAPLAKVGARLPGGLEIKRARLRGVESFGMLCSAQELGLAEAASGLLALPEEAPVGVSLREYLELDDAIFEIDLTPNRGDCLSVAGVAREVSALTGATLHAPDIREIAPVGTGSLEVEILSPEACPRYAGRVLRGVDVCAPTPLWMQERLRRAGLRSLGAVVDVANYVMLELGQPMHAFDLGCLDGGLRVRRAQPGETLTLLDGQDLGLRGDELVIADQRRTLALAGIMGGQYSAVSGSTRDLFLESAFFAPREIAGRARRFGLHTDSSHRFERGVDPQLQRRALERATALLLETVGGEPGPVIERHFEDQLPRRSPIGLRAARVRRLLGVEIEAEETARILSALGCQVDATEEGWRAVPPSFRFDLEMEADLIEELGRVHGYHRIPDTQQWFRPQIQALPEARLPLNRIQELLVDLGYHEAITFSFVDETLQRAMDPEHAPKQLANPLSTELSAMRTSLWPGLVQAVRHNLNRQQTRVRVFETGLRFLVCHDGLRQVPTLAGAVTGTALPEQWSVAVAREVDLFDIKGDVEALLALAGPGQEPEYHGAQHPALHPGQSAMLSREGRTVGWLGALHPELESRFGLGQRVYLFELDLEALQYGAVPRFRPLSRYPAIRRDIAILVDEAVTAAEVRAAILAIHLPSLQEVCLFDVYTGPGVTPGRKSLALGLILQDLSRTLMEQEVEQAINRIVNRLRRDVGATLRE
jgi:phenylalanyl-tRNA synthetase beta chain